MNDVVITQFELFHLADVVGRIALIRCGLKNTNPKATLDTAVSTYVGNEGYNEYINIELDNLWLRLIVKNINELNYLKCENPHFQDVDVFDQRLPRDNRNPNSRLAILRGGLTSERPIGYMNSAVFEYTGGSLHNEFIESTLDNPWIRIILFDINNIEYQPFTDQRINGTI